MKRFFAFLLIFSLSVQVYCAPSEIYIDDIRDVDGIIYYKDESTPFTGKIKDSKDRNYYLNGRPHGKWVTFHPSGAMKSIENWENGKLNGKYILYQENGTKIMETRFVNGVEDGIYILYFPDGKVQIRGTLKNGDPKGLWQYYDKNGKLINSTEH